MFSDLTNFQQAFLSILAMLLLGTISFFLRKQYLRKKINYLQDFETAVSGTFSIISETYNKDTNFYIYKIEIGNDPEKNSYDEKTIVEVKSKGRILHNTKFI